MTTGLAEAQAAEHGNLYGAGNGFGRTDALGRIGNYVFRTEPALELPSASVWKPKLPGELVETWPTRRGSNWRLPV